MTCELCDALLQGALDETLSEEERLECNAHLNSCERCRRAFDAALTIEQAAKGLQADPPEALLSNVMFALERGEKKPRRFAFGRFTALAGVAAAVLLVIYFGGTQNWFAAFTPARADLPPLAILGGDTSDTSTQDEAGPDTTTVVPEMYAIERKSDVPESDQIDIYDTEKAQGSALVEASSEIMLINRYMNALRDGDTETVGEITLAETNAALPDVLSGEIQLAGLTFSIVDVQSLAASTYTVSIDMEHPPEALEDVTHLVLELDAANHVIAQVTLEK